MLNSIPLLIILMFYALICIFILLFNNLHNKKYLNYICASNIFVIVTILLLLASSSLNDIWIMRGLTSTAFICGIYFGYIALCNLLETKFPLWLRGIGILLLPIDFFSFSFLTPFSVFLHKIVFMTVFIYFGIKILKRKHNPASLCLLAHVNILFPVLQFGLFAAFLLKTPINSFWGNIIYTVQNFGCSMIYVFIAIEQTKMTYTSEVSSLQTEALLTENKFKEFDEISRLKSDLFTTLSHELKTPVNVIYSNVQLFEQFITVNNLESTIDYNKYLTSMRTNCYRLVNLVNNIIDINKVESGFMDVKLINYDIVPWLEDVVSSVRSFAILKNIDLLFDTELEELTLAYDLDKTEKIMLNLLSNAIKYTPTGGEILVYVSKTDAFLSVSVQDTGIGIPEELHDVIFNRFVQNKSALHKNHDGSGIGLALVKSLVELQHGSITIDTEYRAGCKFVFCLPFVTIKNVTSSLPASLDDNLFVEFY